MASSPGMLSRPATVRIETPVRVVACLAGECAAIAEFCWQTPHERGLTASEAAFVVVEESAPCRCTSSRSPIRDGPRCSPGPSTGFSTDRRSVDTRKYGAAILGSSAAAICPPCPAATRLGGHQCRLSQEGHAVGGVATGVSPSCALVCMPEDIRRPILPHPPSLWV
jgi:hypothetical protein